MLSIDAHVALLIQRFNDEVDMEHPASLPVRSDGHCLDNETGQEVKAPYQLVVYDKEEDENGSL
jgi:hypothetical protein